MKTLENDKAENNFINEKEIWEIISEGEKLAQDSKNIINILKKAATSKGLTLIEAAALLALNDEDLLKNLSDTAHKVKKDIYGRRLVIFAPLYLSDYCINECLYCAYQHSNKNFKRHQLTSAEIATETKALLSMGHKRLALETGEDPEINSIDYLVKAIETIYKTELNKNRIRRVNVNIAATTVEDYKRLKSAGIGTYVLFQETYHQKTYQNYHQKGPKADYLWHLNAMHRAMDAGLGDVGLGVLFGLYDWRFDTIAMLKHAQVLEQHKKIGPHTFSVPRIRKADGINSEYPHAVSDFDFLKIIAVLRLTAPYAGLLLSTRESGDIRKQFIHAGISQISAGSCTGVGGYAVKKDQDITAQFSVEEKRDHLDIIKEIVKLNYLPSYCTACYRQGRTGDRFMSLAKSGEIQQVCHPNALLTFKEYLEDFGDEQLKELGQKVIEKSLNDIKIPFLKDNIKIKLNKISLGERDFFE